MTNPKEKPEVPVGVAALSTVPEIYANVVRSLFGKVKHKHPFENPQALILKWATDQAKINEALCSTSIAEAFVLTAMGLSVSLGYHLKDKGPAEVAEFIKAMSEIFAYTLADRIPAVIDGLNKGATTPAQEPAGKVVVVPGTPNNKVRLN